LLLSQHFHLVISNLNVHLFALLTRHTNQLHLIKITTISRHHTNIEHKHIPYKVHCPSEAALAESTVIFVFQLFLTSAFSLNRLFLTFLMLHDTIQLRLVAFQGVRKEALHVTTNYLKQGNFSFFSYPSTLSLGSQNTGQSLDWL